MFEKRWAEQRIPWVEGGDILFNDTFLHTAVNLHDEEELILWINIPRADFPWRHNILNRFCIWLAGYLEPRLYDYVQYIGVGTLRITIPEAVSKAAWPRHLLSTTSNKL